MHQCITPFGDADKTPREGPRVWKGLDPSNLRHTCQESMKYMEVMGSALPHSIGSDGKPNPLQLLRCCYAAAVAPQAPRPALETLEDDLVGLMVSD